MKPYSSPCVDLLILDAQDVVRTSNELLNGISVGDGANDIKNWYFSRIAE